MISHVESHGFLRLPSQSESANADAPMIQEKVRCEASPVRKQLFKDVSSKTEHSQSQQFSMTRTSSSSTSRRAEIGGPWWSLAKSTEDPTSLRGKTMIQCTYSILLCYEDDASPGCQDISSDDLYRVDMNTIVSKQATHDQKIVYLDRF